jgi:5-methylcytosine-specific restriction endonuclease McrA
VRRCLLEPIPEIFMAAELLNQAAEAHLVQDYASASKFIKEADRPSIAEWTEFVWGKRQSHIHWNIRQESPLPHLPVESRPTPRMPTAVTRQLILQRDGYHCVFCRIPVVPAEVRKFLTKAYPEEARWGRRNSEQHAALQCMWLQFDHLVPNQRGGDSSLSNVAITCAPCNFGRMEQTLAEAGLCDPLEARRGNEWALAEVWDGLTRLS